MGVKDVIDLLKSHADARAVEGMSRFGIQGSNALGISMPVLRAIAKEVGKDHAIAEGLWKSGIHEARILAGLVEDVKQVSAAQMEAWVKDFDSWDVCDQVCTEVFRKHPSAYACALKWSRRRPEFEKRAGFALMASLAVHDKKAADDVFLPLLEAIRAGADDERNFVKKAVNWALRQIGKRNRDLNRLAIETAEAIKADGTPSGRWLAADALRELRSEKVQERLHKRGR